MKLSNVGLSFKLDDGSSKDVLSDVSLFARPGDRIGLLGQNGAGKTTLLRLMNGVYVPTSGQIIRKGRVGSLINASVGMDLRYSAAENVRWRAYEKGAGLEEQSAILDDVASFAELGSAFDQPMKTYSAGMLARIAFSIATAFPADIFLMDEWLSAGDSRFREKSLERITNLFTDKSILFLASHSEGLISDWCNSTIVLHDGRKVLKTDVFKGLRAAREIINGADPNEIASQYSRDFDDQSWSVLSSDALNESQGAFTRSTAFIEPEKDPKRDKIEPNEKGEYVFRSGRDYDYWCSETLYSVSPGDYMRISGSFLQVEGPTNGRPSGCFIGFILYDNDKRRMDDAFAINRFTQDLKPSNGQINGEFDFKTPEDTDIAFVRPYAGINYSGSAPHSDGVAQFKDVKLYKKKRP